MVTSANDCLKRIDQAALGLLDDTTLETLATEIQQAVDKRAAQRALGDLAKILGDSADEVISNLKDTKAKRKQDALAAIVAKNELLTLVERAEAATGDASLGLEAGLVGVNAEFAGARASVDADQQGIFNTTVGGMISEMQKENLVPVFLDRNNELHVVNALDDIQRQRPVRAGIPKDARRVAEIINKYQLASIALENRAGAWIKERKGRITRTSHDAGKMERAGFEEWAKFEKPLIDFQTMGVRAGTEDEVLKEIYRNITTGVQRDIIGAKENDLLFSWTGPASLQKKASASRRVVYKDGVSWHKHNERFGYGGFREAVLMDFKRAAQNTALMRRFGPNPEALFDRVRNQLVQKHQDNLKQVRRLNRLSLRNQFREVDGSVNHDLNWTMFGVNMANFGRGMRAVQSMAKLGFSFFTSLGDPVFASAGVRNALGEGVWKAHSDAFGAIFDGLTKQQTKDIAMSMGLGLDTILGEVAQRFHAQDQLSGKMSEIMRMFFKLNLLSPWTDGNKRGVGVYYTSRLAQEAGKSWEKLPDGVKTMMARYGLTEEMWEVARKAVTKDDDGRPLLLPGEVSNVDLPDMDQLAAITLKDDTRIALGRMFADLVESATPTPGSRERSILRQGQPAGTPLGEGVRYIAQLKAFPVTVLTKVLGPMFYRGKVDVAGLSALVAGTTVIGMVSTQLIEMAKGREPRPWDLSLVRDGFIRGGAAGLYTDFIFSESEKFGRSFLATTAGPVFSELNKLENLYARLQAGQDVGASSLKFLQSNIPGNNLFYTKAAFDYLIFYNLQEMANPGYLQRMEQSVRGLHGQDFFIKPSRVIKHGGPL